ncbi:MAG: lipoate protein ligase C-terminal domain-containing protein [Parcubacteria group bacterium]
MKKIDYKVEGGKFLRMQIDIKDGVIKDIKIRGDFFVYPETAIFQIEDFLKGKKLESFASLLSSYIKEKNIKIIGFSVADLEKSLQVEN